MDKKDYVSIEVSEILEKMKCNLSTPSLYDVQKWLREKHNIHITIGNSASGYWWEVSKADNGTYICDFNDSGPNDGGRWDLYEDALDAAILTILNSKIIKKK